MTRKRRSNRCAAPDKMDAAVVLFHGKQPGETELSGRYWSISLRIAIEMVENGEAEAIEVQSPDNGTYLAYVETDLGIARRSRNGRQLRDMSCSMGPSVTEQAAMGAPKFRALVQAWAGNRHVPAVRQRCREQVKA